MENSNCTQLYIIKCTMTSTCLNQCFNIISSTREFIIILVWPLQNVGLNINLEIVIYTFM